MSKKGFCALAVALGFALSAAGLLAQSEGAKGIGAAAKATVTATVVKIDSANRILSLKGEDGDVVDVSVSEAVKRFPEIKVGDKLNITYMEALLVSVAKAESATALGSSVEQTLEPKKGGDRPAAVATRRIKATVGVDSVDLDKRLLKVHTADGSSETFHIQDPKRAEGVKPGDKITLVYEEAVAVSITAPAAAAMPKGKGR
jgi:Cu/Ag efflux protein CusF